MILKTLLLLISISSFVAAGLVDGRRDDAIFLMKLSGLLLISLLAFYSLYVKTGKFQGYLGKQVVEKAVIILLPIGILFIFLVGFFLHAGEGDRIIWGTIDSAAYYIQAKIFASGHANVPSHELKEFFSTGFCINDGKFYSKYFPGWPAILSIGVGMGVPWLINPVLGALSVILIYYIGKELFGRETGLFSAILLVSSRYFYVLTPTYFSEPAALFFSGLFFYFMIKTLKEPKLMTSMLAGLFLGTGFLIRPYSALAISFPVMGYFILSTLMQKERPFKPLMCTILAFLPALPLLLLYNHLQTGSPFLTPFQYYNPADALGFGLRSFDSFVDPFPYTFYKAVRNTSVNLALLNLDSVPFLFLFLALIFVNNTNKWDKLLLATLFSIIFFQMFYFYREPRYYYPAFFSLFILAARGINLSNVILKRFFPLTRVKNLNGFFLLFIIAANIFIIITPQKSLHDFKSAKKIRDPFDFVKKNNIHNAVVFLRTVPMQNNYSGIYVQNPLDFNGDVLFVKDLKERNIELMEYYPEKKFYYYDFDFRAKIGKLTVINTKLNK